jgi:hypothetical protein
LRSPESSLFGVFRRTRGTLHASSNPENDLSKIQSVAKAQHDVAKAQHDVAKAQHDVAKAQRDVAKAQRDVAITKRDVAITKRDVAITKRDKVIDSTIWRFLRPYRAMKRLEFQKSRFDS